MNALMTTVLALGLLIAPCTSWAEAAPAAADTISTRLPGLEVSAALAPWLDTALDNDALDARRGENLGERLDGLPGVAAVRRAASAAEPVIRGLGWERVRTMLGAVPLYGACPGRMDPPATYLTPLAADEVTVFRNGGAGPGGGGGDGGAIVARPDYERAAGEGDGTDPWLGLGYGSAREALRVEGGVLGRTPSFDFKAGVGYRSFDDYTAPDGTVVPAGQTTSSVAGSLAWRARPDQRLWYAGTYVHETDIDFPALPMDNVTTDFQAHNLGWRSTADNGLLRCLELTAGLSTIDHLMDNHLKPNWGVMRAATTSETASWGVHAVGDLVPREGWRLRTGLDLTNLTRDATRTREVVATGATSADRLWPDAVQLDAGAFAELGWDLGSGRELQVGGRGDIIDSRARAADAASLGGRTVREQYVNFYGVDAATTDRTETLGQVSLGLTGTAGRRGQWELRTGMSTRAAGVTERYYAFGPAPGGFQVGDPSLAAEKKWESEVGLTIGGDHLTAGVRIFHARIGDYILPTVIERRDVNGDAVVDVIKGFANVDATLAGGEVGWEYRPTGRLQVPLTVSLVRGRNTTDGRDLPEMPPLFGTAAVRWLGHPGTRTWLIASCDFAADQNRIDPVFPENRTGGWAVWSIGLESRPRAGWRLGLTVRNLFDRLYIEHLTREALLPVGGLAAGQEIPAPGRSLEFAARLGF